MSQNGGIEVINQSLPELHATLVQDPLIVDKSRISIISFSDSAEVILPMTKATDVADMPGLSATTHAAKFGPVFQVLRETIQRDLDLIKSEGFRVYRPAVFFISGSEPADPDWENQYQLLMNSRYAPHVISWGVDDADAATLQRIATPKMKAFLGGADRVTAARALRQMLSSLFHDWDEVAHPICGLCDLIQLPSEMAFGSIPDD
jgi:uncharacterized protein YegL